MKCCRLSPKLPSVLRAELVTTSNSNSSPSSTTKKPAWLSKVSAPSWPPSTVLAAPDRRRYCHNVDGKMQFRGLIASLDGKQVLETTREGAWDAQSLLDAGKDAGAELKGRLRRTSLPT